MQHLHSLLMAATILLIGSTVALPMQPADPIIGIVSTPLSSCGAPPSTMGNKAIGCIDSFYVRWLEAAGVRVVPFPWNITGTARSKLLASINGVLFPGGGLSGSLLTEYYERTKYIVDYAIEGDKKGDPFFVWGTCEGFQVVTAAAAGNLSVIEGGFPGMYPLMMALNFTSNTANSKMLNKATLTENGGLWNVLQNQKCTLNWHDCGVTYESTAPFSGFRSQFNVLSTNADPVNGRQFLSAIEAKTANIFAVQFHPERPPYEFSDDNIGHTIGDIAVSQYLARFIVQRLRMNNHTFSSPQAAEAQMIENSVLTIGGYGHRMYWITN